MDETRYFEQRAMDYAAAARATSDRWYALRFKELAEHYAAMARQALPAAAGRKDLSSST